MKKALLIKIAAGLMALVMLVPSVISCASNKEGTTTTVDTENLTPERDTAALLASDVYASDGLAYVLDTCERYYVKRTGILKRGLSNSNACEIWYLAAYIEMLAEAYKLYPDNEDVKSYYVDVLEKCLPAYEVNRATIRNPGKTYPNQMYYNAGRGSSGDFYYDDNAWICYQYIEAYELLGEDKYLEKAEKLLEFLWTGWRIKGGGIYWDKTFGGIAVCASSPVTTCFLRTYIITGNQDYLDKAEQIYSWLTKNVKGNNNLYYAGVGDPWQPSYDQGTMIYNGSLLYKITEDEKYYKEAKSTANAVLSHCFNVTGGRNDRKVSLKTNPYYCPWSFAWLMRGMIAYYDVSESLNEGFMTFFKQIIDERRGVLNRNKQYDPYLGTGCMDWLGNGRTFSSDDLVIMPAGYSSMLLLIAYFDVYQSQDILESNET